MNEFPRQLQARQLTVIYTKKDTIVSVVVALYNHIEGNLFLYLRCETQTVTAETK